MSSFYLFCFSSYLMNFNESILALSGVTPVEMLCVDLPTNRRWRRMVSPPELLPWGAKNFTILIYIKWLVHMRLHWFQLLMSLKRRTLNYEYLLFIGLQNSDNHDVNLFRWSCRIWNYILRAAYQYICI